MKIVNRHASAGHEVLEHYEAGIALTGQEASSIVRGRLNLSRSYVKIIGGEAYLINADIPSAKDPKRTRKLLLHKRQLLALETKVKQQKLTLIPLSMYTKRHLVKLEFALAKPRRKHEKKEALKRRDLDREVEIELKRY